MPSLSFQLFTSLKHHIHVTHLTCDPPIPLYVDIDPENENAPTFQEDILRLIQKKWKSLTEIGSVETSINSIYIAQLFALCTGTYQKRKVWIRENTPALEFSLSVKNQEDTPTTYDPLVTLRYNHHQYMSLTDILDNVVDKHESFLDDPFAKSDFLQTPFSHACISSFVADPKHFHSLCVDAKYMHITDSTSINICKDEPIYNIATFHLRDKYFPTHLREFANELCAQPFRDSLSHFLGNKCPPLDATPHVELRRVLQRGFIQTHNDLRSKRSEDNTYDVHPYAQLWFFFDDKQLTIDFIHKRRGGVACLAPPKNTAILHLVSPDLQYGHREPLASSRPIHYLAVTYYTRDPAFQHSSTNAITYAEKNTPINKNIIYV